MKFYHIILALCLALLVWSIVSKPDKSSSSYKTETWLWGYINQQGEIHVKPAYEEAHDFRNGRARVRKDGKYGYIDTSGMEVIECTFDGATDFSQDLAAVRTEKGWGYINKNGAIRIPALFSGARIFSSNLAAVKKDGKWGYIDWRGRFVLKPQFDEAGDFSNSIAPVRRTMSDNVKAYKAMRQFPGLGFGPNERTTTSFSEWHFILKNGRAFGKKRFDQAGRSGSGCVPVMITRRTSNLESESGKMRVRSISSTWRFITSRGKYLTGTGFYQARKFCENLAAVQAIDGMQTKYVGFSEKMKGRIVELYKIRYKVPKPGKWGYILSTGNYRIAPQFDAAKDFSDSLAPVSKDNLWGYINYSGQFVIRPAYQDAEPFSGGLARIYTEAGYGYIDKSGAVKVKPKYQQAGDFYEGLARVYVKTK